MLIGGLSTGAAATWSRRPLLRMLFLDNKTGKWLKGPSLRHPARRRWRGGGRRQDRRRGRADRQPRAAGQPDRDL